MTAGLIAATTLTLVFGAAVQAPAPPPPRVDVTADLSSAQRLADEWTLDGNGVWAIADGLLVLEKAGVPGGPIRRPGALAVLKTTPLGDATLDVDMRSHAPEDVTRRDLLLVAGWQSPTRFYYVHLSAVRDNVHNGIFLVDGADRKRIDDQSQRAMLTDRAWHRARLVRAPATGRIEVFVDGESSPIMTATDTAIPSGRMGVGSFDDTGAFRRIRVQGTAAQP
jgi:hypothetical protein